MSKLKTIAKKIPFLTSVHRMLLNQYLRCKLKSKNAEQVFNYFYMRNAWGASDSVSGTGSDVFSTRRIINALPIVFREYGIKTMLDIPCGDFHWMKNVDLSGVEYTGADIVSDLIAKNSATYASDGVRFQKLNLIEDPLSAVDLIFCRDCLVHLSLADITSALRNLCRSDARYLLTTTFTERRRNPDIVTGQWRPVNLECAPFSFPAPLKLIDEGCTEGDGEYTDKSLGLWKIADIPATFRG